MKNQVLVIGNVRRFSCFLLLYTLFVAAIVLGACIIIHHLHTASAANAGATLISLSENVLLI